MEPHIETAMRDMTGLPILLWDGTYPSKFRCPTCFYDFDLFYQPGYCEICRAMTAIIVIEEPCEMRPFRLLGPMLNPPWGPRTLEQVRTWIQRIQLSDRYRDDVDMRLSDMLGSLEMATNALRYGRMDDKSVALADRCDELKRDINRYLNERLSTTPPTSHMEGA